jgi:hypothetical protein
VTVDVNVAVTEDVTFIVVVTVMVEVQLRGGDCKDFEDVEDGRGIGYV